MTSNIIKYNGESASASHSSFSPGYGHMRLRSVGQPTCSPADGHPNGSTNSERNLQLPEAEKEWLKWLGAITESW
jgi:hypothetical protein